MKQRALIAGLGGALSVLLCVAAAAQDAGTGDHGIGHDFWHEDFYATLRRNDGGGPCCNMMDLSVRTLLIGVCAACTTLCAGACPAEAQGYVQTNLVSDLMGVAAFTDPNLVNPWGLASSPTSPIWVSNNGTGVATLYNGAGVAQSLVVTIPANPTGVAFNSNSMSFGGAPFIFATERGTIAAWNPSVNGTVATVEATTPGAVYKGLAIDNNIIYATNFASGQINVFNSSFAPVTSPGGFVDPNLPAGFAPFGIQNIGGDLYVTYAKQDAAKHDPIAGTGNGFVDVFDANANFVQRLVSNGVLNAPWGLALAPANFGAFSNDLLVGNFGDGTINAYDLTTGAFLGELKNPQGNPVVIPGLWGLLFGNGGNGGALNELFFSAGIPGPSGNIEDHGLFGDLTASVPEPSTWAMMLLGFVGLGFAFHQSRRKASFV
jgi:uncharacterized protein (TIGR03118 family)